MCSCLPLPLSTRRRAQQARSQRLQAADTVCTVSGSKQPCGGACDTRRQRTPRNHRYRTPLGPGTRAWARTGPATNNAHGNSLETSNMIQNDWLPKSRRHTQEAGRSMPKECAKSARQVFQSVQGDWFRYGMVNIIYFVLEARPNRVE